MAPRDDEVDELDIRPGVRMLALFPHMNYKPWYALGEFVDNSIQSYLDLKTALRRVDGTDYRLRVVISIDPSDGGSMKVWDNAGGIALKDYRRAFVTAEPPPNSAGLSQFGIGMKSAACWFAKKWSVRTKALGEEVSRTVDFDVKKITESGTEHLKPRTRSAPASEHFTEISLHGLNRPLVKKTVGKMKDHLKSIYRVFLRRGELQLIFNDEPLEFDEPDILIAPPAGGSGAQVAEVEWRKEITFSLHGGHHVQGFAALRQVGSTSKAGFALFRNDRLVQGSDDESYRPREIFGGANSYTYQRLFGEFNLTGFDVSHTKDVFLWGDLEEPFLDKLKAALNARPMPLLHQAENYRSRTLADNALKNIERAADNTADAIAGLGNAVSEQVASEPEAAAPAPTAPDAPSASRRDIPLEVSGETWIITLDLTTDLAATDWLELFDTEAGPAGSRDSKYQRRLGIRVAMLHPFMHRFAGPSSSEIEPLLRIAAGLALAETTARESGVQMAGVIRKRLNNLLSESLAEPLAR